jgi:murein DD-endopeptidase MepM/ murein hydrolase activator NlpD
MWKPFAKGSRFIKNTSRSLSSFGLLILLGLLAACESPQIREPNSDRPPQISFDSSSGITPNKIEESVPFKGGLFEWPVDVAKLTRGFKAKTGRRRAHLGIDLAASKGSPIYAAQDGVVIYVGSGFTGYGRMIMVEGKEGFATLYAHLSKAITHEGANVVKGQVIGAMGRTGRASGVHLHFEIRRGKGPDKGPVDPLLYLPSTIIPGTKSARRENRDTE